MRVLALVAVAAIVSGCAARVVSSSPRSVVVDSESQGVAAAQKLADSECGKHGLHARLVNRPRFGSNEYLFDCVP